MATTDATIANIRQVWMNWDLSITTLKKGTTLFTGQASCIPGFDPDALVARESLWLSQSAYYAARYGYWTGTRSPVQRSLVALTLKQDLELVEFPAGRHPADAFKVDPGAKGDYAWRKDMTAAGMQPDHFVSRHWASIIAGTPLEGFIGHCRPAVPEDAESFGTTPGDLIEVWLSEGTALRVEQCRDLPNDLEAFLERHQADKQGLAAATFSSGIHRTDSRGN